MNALGFDNDKYVKLQSQNIRDRISQFGGKLYLEFGGKLFDDYHASRVLPGFKPDSKVRMLLEMKDVAEIVIAISADDIERSKRRGDLGITYEDDTLRLIDAFRGIGLYIGSVVVTHYRGQAIADKFMKRLEALGVRPDDTATMYKLADVLAEDNKPFIAMDVLNNLVQIKPDFSDAAIFLGNLAYDAKFYDRAESAYELAAKQGNAESVFGFKNMAYDAHAEKRDDEALRLLRIAQKYFPDDVTVQADILEFEKN